MSFHTTRSDTQIETFALAIHEYNGSPALTLLRDLGCRMRTVRQLMSYLESMPHEKCLSLLKKPGECTKLAQHLQNL